MAETGIPPSPVGWLITTARNKALDRLRKEASRSERQHAAQLLNDVEQAEEHDVHDDHLRLIFTCCHPALAPDAQVALTLRLIGGLGTEEIAHAFLLQPTTLAQRISRAKAKIRDANIPVSRSGGGGATDPRERSSGGGLSDFQRRLQRVLWR